MLRKSIIITSVISFIMIASVGGIALATVSYVSVKPGEDVSRSIDLQANDRVLIEFSVAWGAEASTIGFSLVSPNGTITDFGEQGTFSFSFVCHETGLYTLHFVNQGSTATKLVTLEYKIDHYLFGLTSEMFWLLLIAVVCMVAAVVYFMYTRTS